MVITEKINISRPPSCHLKGCRGTSPFSPPWQGGDVGGEGLEVLLGESAMCGPTGVSNCREIAQAISAAQSLSWMAENRV